MEFRPTYLYIKQHSLTGLKYFGKTTRHPEKYPGSGSYWQKHYRQHGKKYIVTLWSQLFNDKEECTRFALNFSKENNIVESDQWANLMPENGLDGGAMPGRKQSEEEKLLRSKIMSGKKKSEEHKLHLRGKKRSPEYCKWNAERKKGNTHRCTQIWELKSPGNEIIEATNMAQFCRENNLDGGTFARWRNRLNQIITSPQCTGWSILSIRDRSITV